MVSQTKLIHDAKWDNLIILDACRYDYFAKVYNNYFSERKLLEVESPASCTADWLIKTWKDKYDYTYISGNPYINSKSIPCKDYVATKHFKKIIDVWDYGWNKKLGTVLPITINQAILNMKHNCRKKLIIHYVQPHYPYIGETRILVDGQRLPNEWNEPTPSPLRLKQRKKQNLKTWLQKNVSTFKQAYIDNLDLVLYYVSLIIPYLDGNIVITTDHGDILCDLPKNDSIIWHPCHINHPILRNVPWLEVKR